MTCRAESAVSFRLSGWTLGVIIGVALLIVVGAGASRCWLQDEFPFHAAFPACGADTSGYGGWR